MEKDLVNSRSVGSANYAPAKAWKVPMRVTRMKIIRVMVLSGEGEGEIKRSNGMEALQV